MSFHQLLMKFLFTEHTIASPRAYMLISNLLVAIKEVQGQYIYTSVFFIRGSTELQGIQCLSGSPKVIELHIALLMIR